MVNRSKCNVFLTKTILFSTVLLLLVNITMPKKKTSKASKYLVGAGVAAAVAAGVLSFLTQTKKGKALKKKGVRHASDITKKIALKAEKMRKLSQDKYDELVDEVIAEYQKRKKITKASADELAAQLKKEWTQVRKELKK